MCSWPRLLPSKPWPNNSFKPMPPRGTASQALGVTEEFIAPRSKAPIWQRVISALTLGVTWASVTRALNSELDTCGSKGGMLAALYGGYLFGYFALRGQLPGVLAGQHGAQPRGTGDG